MSVNHCESANVVDVFPKIPGVKVKFSIDKSVPPERNAYFNVPAAFLEAAKHRLDEMEAKGIIEKVTTAPEWISGMSAVAKGKNDFRLVVNMRGPNKAIKREYFRLPLLEEMRVKLHGSKFFSKLDLSNAYYHLELSKESRDLTTFLAENGMYRFTRLMFGVNCAPEVFQREMCRLLENVDNIIVYIDDVLLFAETLEQLRLTTTKVLQIFRNNCLSLNNAKCEFEKTRIQFLGHELDANGFHIEETKIRDLRKFRQPATVSELRSFLGLASFVSPHVSNFADIAAPLWAAAAAKAWSWGPEQERAFERMKNHISHCTTTLGYFAENHNTILYTDASPHALGAVLVQEDENHTPRIISFASKALTATEKRYPQNQREALSAVWAVEHFWYFLLGRRFTLRTDASGIVFILNRLRETSKRALNRADGWALRLSPYDYKVEYVRGRDNIADPSSRLYIGMDDPFNNEQSPWEIATLEANAVGFLTEQDIRRATAEDEELLNVDIALETGQWPDGLKRYQSLAEDLHFSDGILVKKGCAVIPAKLRDKTLDLAHDGHPGAAKMKTILRERVWWPGMAADAVKWVDACRTCATNGWPEKPTPMKRVFAPKTVWESIAVDFNGPYVKFGGISILLIVDYRSRFLIARVVKSTSFDNTRSVFDEIFEREGFSKNIRSDNGPPFNGDEYRQYCTERGIDRIFSTPLFPQQNGLVEGYMKLVNRAMAAAAANNTGFKDELRSAVNAHNAAAHAVTGIPPEEVMLGRKIKRRLPLLIHQKSEHDESLLDERDRLAKLKAKDREDARRGARACRVKPGDTVIVERQSKGKAVSRFDSQRYTVIEENNGNLVLSNQEGQILKRHVTQTKKVQQWREVDGNASTSNDHNPSEEMGRPTRDRKAPAYLESYVRRVES